MKNYRLSLRKNSLKPHGVRPNLSNPILHWSFLRFSKLRSTIGAKDTRAELSKRAQMCMGLSLYMRILVRSEAIFYRILLVDSGFKTNANPELFPAWDLSLSPRPGRSVRSLRDPRIDKVIGFIVASLICTVDYQFFISSNFNSDNRIFTLNLALISLEGISCWGQTWILPLHEHFWLCSVFFLLNVPYFIFCLSLPTIYIFCDISF